MQHLLSNPPCMKGSPTTVCLAGLPVHSCCVRLSDNPALVSAVAASLAKSVERDMPVAGWQSCNNPEQGKDKLGCCRRRPDAYQAVQGASCSSG